MDDEARDRCCAVPSLSGLCEVIEIPFSGILSSASGDYSVGEAFSGVITYNREPYEDGTTYPFGIGFTFKVGTFQYVPEVTYASFQAATGSFRIAGARSDSTSLEFLD